MESYPKKRAGRKMKVGKWVFCERTGRSGIFLGYAEDLCVGNKVIVDRDFITEVTRWVRKDKKSWSYRLAEWIMRSRML